MLTPPSSEDISLYSVISLDFDQASQVPSQSQNMDGPPPDDEPLVKKLKIGIQSFVQYFRDGAWSEILIRVAIFVILTFIVHSIFVWYIYTLLIPLLQMWLMDAALEEAKARLEKVEWKSFRNFDMSDL